MTAPSTQVMSLLTQFGLTTAAGELVSRLTEAGHQEAMPVLVEVFEAEAEARRQRRVTRLRRASAVAAGQDVRDTRHRQVGNGNQKGTPTGSALSVHQSPLRHLPRRHAGRREVRARAGGHGHLLGADPPRLPAGVGEAAPRPGGDHGRGRGAGGASPGVLPGREGP